MWGFSPMSVLPGAQTAAEKESYRTNRPLTTTVDVTVDAGPEGNRVSRTLLHFPRHEHHPAPGAWIHSRRRRAFDIFVAIAALLALAPLLLVAALLVRLSSPGPIFFRQRRMGRHGREFTLYKFRSMRVCAVSGSAITVVGDARITRIGAFLRRYKLDELPQFWNVLKGDMSLVGPRPKLPQHEALYLRVRPGITGPATLAFRQEEEVLAGIPPEELDSFYQEVVKPSKAWIDMEYIAHATFRSDLRLLTDTCTSCLGVFQPRSTEEWIALYRHVRASYEMPVNKKLSA
jgi:lipopolysaccharide/colanic/teichoic acid biosynthesis glycosyltransferase